MTVKKLHEKLCKLIEDGKEGYEVMTESYCCGTDDVEVSDELCKINID